MRLAEEFMLLLRDDEGVLSRAPNWYVRYALGGAVLMDLALEHRIDTDAQRLFIIDSTPVGDKLLDPMLGEISKSERSHDALYWLEQATHHADEIQETALTRLIDNKILELRDDRTLWIFGTKRYILKDERVEHKLIRRIKASLVPNSIPDPKDIMIVTLADGCGLLADILTRNELAASRKQIEFLRNVELFGRVFLETLDLAVQPAARKLDGVTNT